MATHPAPNPNDIHSGSGAQPFGGLSDGLSFDFTPAPDDGAMAGAAANVDLLGSAATSPGGDADAPAWSYYLGLSKPISIGLDPPTPPSADGTSFALPTSTPGDNSGVSFLQSGDPGPDMFSKPSGGAGPGGGHGGGGGGGGGGLMPYTASNASGMTFVVNWDSSVGNAPSVFQTGVESAVQYFLDKFANPITITLDVGYGEVLGQNLPFGVLGESSFGVNSFHYSDVYTALQTQAGAHPLAPEAQAFGTLPTDGSDPLGAGNYLITSADQKALGLVANGNNLDGGVGFAKNSRIVPWNYGSTTTGSQYDFVSVAKHEISEVMGRVAWVGQSVSDAGTIYNDSYSNLDLFRWSGFDTSTNTGTRSTANGDPGYLSFDGGHTDLSDFNTNASQGDLGDWAITGTDQTPSNDAYNYAGGLGPQFVSQVDAQVMNVLGYTLPT